MYEEGYYWVRVAIFLGWSIAYCNGEYWKLIDDENKYQNIDFNTIWPHKILPPSNQK